MSLSDKPRLRADAETAASAAQLRHTAGSGRLGGHSRNKRTPHAQDPAVGGDVDVDFCIAHVQAGRGLLEVNVREPRIGGGILIGEPEAAHVGCGQAQIAGVAGKIADGDIQRLTSRRTGEEAGLVVEVMFRRQVRLLGCARCRRSVRLVLRGSCRGAAGSGVDQSQSARQILEADSRNELQRIGLRERWRRRMSRRVLLSRQ